jgi:hypothetical protein
MIFDRGFLTVGLRVLRDAADGSGGGPSEGLADGLITGTGDGSADRISAEMVEGPTVGAVSSTARSDGET